MLIQSNFKDYYDSAANIGIDKTIVYKRTTSEVLLEEGFFINGLPRHFPDDLGRETYINGQKFNNRNYCKWMIIGFCGVYHVGVFNTVAAASKKHTIAYFGEDILQLDWQQNEAYWPYNHPKKVAEQVVRQWHLKENHHFFAQLNTPIFTKEILHSLSEYEWKNKGLYLEKFEVNPNISNYQFYKNTDTFTAFQQIQSYLSGVLGTKENETIEVSNKSKIIKAGFDLKTSFRKDKKQ